MNKVTISTNLLLPPHSEGLANILELPEDVIISILCNPILSFMDIERCSSVCSRLWQLSNHEKIWEMLCHRDLAFESEILAHENQTWKKLYYLGTHSLGTIEAIGIKKPQNTQFFFPKDYYIKYDPSIIKKNEKLHLEDEGYKILPLEEARALMEETDTIALLKMIQPFSTKKSPQTEAYGQIEHTTFRYVARQVVDKTEFEIFNYTNILVSFNSNYTLLIDGRPTDVEFTSDNCQIVVYILGNQLMVHTRDRGINKETDVCAFSISAIQKKSRLIRSLPQMSWKNLPRN